MAHRASWILHFGSIPDKLWVLHHCDNRACVNPAHLFLGDNSTNVRDMVEKRRHVHGDRQPTAKLTSTQVVEIRKRYKSGGVTQKQLGELYGVARRTICHVVNDTWKLAG